MANEQNLGFGAAVNQGAREAAGDVLLILNPDAIAEPGAVAALLHCLEATQARARLAVRCWKMTVNPHAASPFADADAGAIAVRSAAGQPAMAGQSGEPPLSLPRCRLFAAAGGRAAGGSMSRRHAHSMGLSRRLRRAVLPGLVRGRRSLQAPARSRCEDFLLPGRALPPWRRPQRGTAAHFRDKQLFWYGNMLRYARKHFSGGQVADVRVAIINGMLLRSVGALFGARQAPLGEALSAYWEVIRT